MILVILNGGLGNQLFQIAKALTIRNGDLRKNIYVSRVGLGFRDRGSIPTALLKQLNIQSINIDNFLVKLAYLALRVLRKLKVKPINTRFIQIVIETDLSQAAPVKAVRHYLLFGYFQHNAYQTDGFNDVLIALESFVTRIKTDLETKAPSINYAKVATAVHYRRGDYLDKENEKHLTLDVEYYKAATYNLIKSAECEFVIFTDSPRDERFECQFADCSITWVEDANLTPFEVMLALSLFSNIVISNSTFSFWSAALSAHRKGNIIRPVEWIKDDYHIGDFICPPDWAKL